MIDATDAPLMREGQDLNAFKMNDGSFFTLRDCVFMAQKQCGSILR